jgi:hypothetical protein
MIKGINHQMIEVAETDNPFFERVLLVLRADCADVSQNRLQEEVRRVVRAAGGYSALHRNRRRRRLKTLFGVLFGCAAGILMGFMAAKGLM